MVARRATKATWWEISVLRAGFRGADAACRWAFKWGGAREALGHEPTVEEVASFWRLSRRTAFREQAAFREVFPELETPAYFYDPEHMRKQIRQLLHLDEAKTPLRHAARSPTDAEVLQLAQNPALI